MELWIAGGRLPSSSSAYKERKRRGEERRGGGGGGGGELSVSVPNSSIYLRSVRSVVQSYSTRESVRPSGWYSARARARSAVIRVWTKTDGSLIQTNQIYIIVEDFIFSLQEKKKNLPL